MNQDDERIFQFLGIPVKSKLEMEISNEEILHCIATMLKRNVSDEEYKLVEKAIISKDYVYLTDMIKRLDLQSNQDVKQVQEK